MMKLTKHKRDDGLSIRLTNQEVLWLKTILNRYNNGKGSMSTPSNGFPVEFEMLLRGGKWLLR
jgi:hypothetical protein